MKGKTERQKLDGGLEKHFLLVFMHIYLHTINTVTWLIKVGKIYKNTTNKYKIYLNELKLIPLHSVLCCSDAHQPSGAPCSSKTKVDKYTYIFI